MANIARGAVEKHRVKRTYDEIHKALLDSAIEVLSERGGIELTVSDVAKRAGTTTGALYSHFHDREGLLRAAYMERIPTAGDPVASVMHFGLAIFSVAEDRAERVVHMEMQVLTKDARAARMATMEAITAAQHSAILHTSVEELAQVARSVLTDAVRASQAAGYTRTDLDAEAIAVTWFGCVLGITLAVSALPDPRTADAVKNLLETWDFMVHQFSVGYVQRPETIGRLQKHLETCLDEEWRATHSA
jgi:AcrR family transcriptional regulator